MRSRARKEASAQEVRGYYKQFAEANHLEYRSPGLATRFLISSTWGRLSREIMWPDDGCSPSTRTNKVTSSGQSPDKCSEVSRTNRKNISRRLHMLPQDPDFGWVAKSQPAKIGAFFTLMLRQLSLDSLMVWTVMLCVNCRQKQVILLILLQDWRNLHTAWMMHPRRWWNILDKALCGYGMFPTGADQCCYVLYSIQSRERTWNQNSSTQWHDASNISTKPRVRTEADAAFEKMLDPIAGSPATGKSVAGIIKFFVDDLFGTGGYKMEQRVLARLRKDFQVGSEDWNDVTFTGQRIRWTKDPQSRPCIEVSQEMAIEELEEIPVQRNTKEDLQCTPVMHTRYRSLLGQMNWLQSRTVSVLPQVFQMCFQGSFSNN